MTSVDDRFWSKVKKTRSGCWLWQATKDRKGYGQFWDRRVVHAHRWVWERLREPIPNGLTIDHLCCVTSCVNPDHMEVVTTQENIRRGRRHNGNKTHCPQGHPYSGSNLYVSPTGGRYCRTCTRDGQRKRYAEKVMSR